METPILNWLSRVGTVAMVLSVCAFVVVNGIAFAVFIRTQDRQLVNRWTGRILAANLAIVSAGLGVPLLTAVARIAVTTFAPAVQPRLELKAQPTEAAPVQLEPGPFR